MQHHLDADFIQSLSSIDASLDNAAKLIHRSNQYVASSTPKQVTVDTHVIGEYPQKPTRARSNTEKGPTTATADTYVRPNFYGRRPETQPPIQPQRKFVDVVVTNNPTPLETDRIRALALHQRAAEERASAKRSREISASGGSGGALQSSSSSSATLPPTTTSIRLAKDRWNGHSLVRVRQACQGADHDGDGMLTKREFQHVLGEMGVTITNKEVEYMCQKYNEKNYQHQQQRSRTSTSTSTSTSSHTGTGTDVASNREPAPAMTVDLEPSKIHYDSFVRGQTDAPLRTRSSIARDTAQDIYKTTGMESGR